MAAKRKSPRLSLKMLSGFSAATELETLVLKFFEGDRNKANLWFATPNPLLGGISPTVMIEAGRCDKLLKWAKQQIAENQPPKP